MRDDGPDWPGPGLADDGPAGARRAGRLVGAVMHRRPDPVRPGRAGGGSTQLTVVLN
ncbi:hypothetical protein [Micromonospora wenchangensis]|uniref:hypothetical protein n=1 Tax=Micromonospora wenchangensis TaxID=1185415 RepID=UPI0013043827|nr:hypothetical protein [Micromonospora wenchangensis]